MAYPQNLLSERQNLTEQPVPCLASWLGLVEYQTAFDIQKVIWTQKVNSRVDDALLFLEHTPTLTLGRSGRLENLLFSPAELARQDVSLFFTDRGGDITYHGPDQLVVYPVIDLKRRGKDVHRYIYDLQEVLILTMADFSIQARRSE